MYVKEELWLAWYDDARVLTRQDTTSFNYFFQLHARVLVNTIQMAFIKQGRPALDTADGGGRGRTTVVFTVQPGDWQASRS